MCEWHWIAVIILDTNHSVFKLQDKQGEYNLYWDS